jgi:endoglucanase
MLFGQFYPAHPVVIGEWGGRCGSGPSGQKDVQWQNGFVDYLISKNMRDTLYWCYTPNSVDTGGILDDQLKVRTDKMTLPRKFWGSEAVSDVRPLSPDPLTVH